jgi:hypothetical protein
MLPPTFPLWTERLVMPPFADDHLAAPYEVEGSEDVTRYLFSGPRPRDEAVND